MIEDKLTYILNCANRMREFVICEEDRDYVRPNYVAMCMTLDVLIQVPSLAKIGFVAPLNDGGFILEWRAHGWSYALETFNHGAIEFYGVEIGGKGETPDDTYLYQDVDLSLINLLRACLDAPWRGSNENQRTV